MQQSTGLLAEQSEGDVLCRVLQNRNKITSRSPKQVPFGINHRFMSCKNQDFFDKQKKSLDNRSTISQNRNSSSLLSCARLNLDKETGKLSSKRNSWQNQDISEKIKEENGLLSQPLPLSHLPRTKIQLELLNEMRIEDEESLIEVDIPQRREDFECQETEEREFKALEDNIMQTEKDKKQMKRPSGSNSTVSTWALLTLQKDYESSSKARLQDNKLFSNKLDFQEQSCYQQRKFTEQEQIPIKKGANSVATLFQKQTNTQKPIYEANRLLRNQDKLQQQQQQHSLIENHLHHSISSSTDQSTQQDQIPIQQNPKEVILSYSSNLINNYIEYSAENQQESQTKATLSNQSTTKTQQAKGQETAIIATHNNIDNKPTLNNIKNPQTNKKQLLETISIDSSEKNNIKTFRAGDNPISEYKTIFKEHTTSPKQLDLKKNQESLFQLQQTLGNDTVTPTKPTAKQHNSMSLVNSEKSKSTNSSISNVPSKPIRTNSHYTQQQQQLCFNQQSTQKKLNDHSNFHSIHSVPTSVSHSDMNYLDESREIPLIIAENQNKNKQQLIEETKERQSSRDRSGQSNRTSQKLKQNNYEISNSFNFINEKSKILNKMSGSYSFNSKDQLNKLEKKCQIVSSSLQKRKITLNIDSKDTIRLRSSDSSKNRSEDKKKMNQIKTSKSPIGKERKQINIYKLNLDEQDSNNSNNRDKSAAKNKNNQVVASRNITLRTSNLSQPRKRETENKKEEDTFTPSHNSTFNFKPSYFTPIPHEDINKFLRKSDCTTQDTY